MLKVNSTEIEQYYPLVESLASKYLDSGIPLEELVQEGLVGVLEAKKNYDATLGISFSNYVSYWIEKKIIEAISGKRRWSLTELKDARAKNTLKNNRIQKNALKKNIRLPKRTPELESRILRMSYREGKTLKEIAKVLGVTRERVRQLKKRAQRRVGINGKLTKNL